MVHCYYVLILLLICLTCAGAPKLKKARPNQQVKVQAEQNTQTAPKNSSPIFGLLYLISDENGPAELESKDNVKDGEIELEAAPEIANEFAKEATQKDVSVGNLMEPKELQKVPIEPEDESENTNPKCHVEPNHRNALLQMDSVLLASQQRHLVGNWFHVEEVEDDNFNKKFNPGDLIEIKIRLGDKPIRAYHWAIYMGDGMIIHLKNVKGSGAEIQLKKLSEMYKKRWMRKNNYMDLFFSPRSVHEILEWAQARVGCKYKYSLLFWNCEHFAVETRYGKIFSLQVRNYARPLTTASATVVNKVASDLRS
ncbi:lecithin retinol acyltransferase domain-containing protein [Ditylenchus destructor]|uniref:Lecithin retinol acyltransferase domain-containing protein n=1 Tax=Ditylenchus destructor TaxID=166010 RepID=A0AAD4N371_9BILA|nr:lecithin retinol acyltransferase domain-containing protein [Ditylenchus destructor]